MESREAGGEDMSIGGDRGSKQPNIYDENFGLHTKDGVVCKAEEAVSSVLMSLAVDILLKPCFMGTLLQFVESGFRYGGTIWHQRWPFTLGSVTRLGITILVLTLMIRTLTAASYFGSMTILMARVAFPRGTL